MNEEDFDETTKLSQNETTLVNNNPSQDLEYVEKMGFIRNTH